MAVKDRWKIKVIKSTTEEAIALILVYEYMQISDQEIFRNLEKMLSND